MVLLYSNCPLSVRIWNPQFQIKGLKMRGELLNEYPVLRLPRLPQLAGFAFTLHFHAFNWEGTLLDPHAQGAVCTLLTYEMFESGRVALPQDLRLKGLDIVRAMSLEQLRTVHPVLESLKQRK